MRGKNCCVSRIVGWLSIALLVPLSLSVACGQSIGVSGSGSIAPTHHPSPSPPLSAQTGPSPLSDSVPKNVEKAKPDTTQASLSGWFHIIWADRPSGSHPEPATRYILIDDQGQWIRLLLEESLVKPLGGPLALNRKRVKIMGARVSESPGTVRVLSIKLE